MPQPYTQDGRPIRLDTPLGDDVLLLEEFSGVETVSQQYSFHLRAVSTSGSLGLENELLQKPVVVSLAQASGESRYFHGIVSRAVQLERSKGLTTYHIEMVPWSWFLSLVTDCRIFKKTTLKDILTQIFSDHNFQDYEFHLGGSYKRDYCVQYRETCLDFISRLMEEEGIFYFFKHAKDKHVLVISDEQSIFAPCPFRPAVEYGLAADSTIDRDVVKTIAVEHSVRSRTVSLADYDFQKPKVNLGVRATSSLYDLYDYPGRYETREVGEQYARIQLEEQEAQRRILAGTSNCRQFVAGYKFDLHDITGQLADDSFVLLSVAHSASATSYRSDGLEPFMYENHFQSIPAVVTYRPPRLVRRPRVEGTQTAVVVGAVGEDFNIVDKYGRVEVKFFWDREDKSSCPVRVSQAWAGKNWGAIHLPRIGQEVIVDFLEGNPDRPLIIGRVYNAEQMPPYDLPNDQTISGVKSRSSKGGGAANYNEIILDDKAGQEFIRIHAEKDLHEFVENNSYEFVGQHRHLMVDGSQTDAVKGDKHQTVSGEHREDVAGDVSITIGGSHHSKVGSLYALDSGQEIHLKGGMKIVIESGMQLSLVGAGGFIDIGPAGVTIQGTMVKINSGGAKGSGTAAAPKAPKQPTKAS